MQSITVQVENLSKRYGANRIFDGISFSHSRGVMGIAGANGSGKSTLLQCLAGLEKATSGVIDWTMGENKIETPTLKENTGYAAPYINLYEEFTAAENLGFLLKLRSIDHKSKTITRALEKNRHCTPGGATLRQPFHGAAAAGTAGGGAGSRPRGTFS